MIFCPTKLAGVIQIELAAQVDERGFFARTFCADEFHHEGLPRQFEQSSLSRNTLAGTLRGMHFQMTPHAEEKFVRCVRGAVFDVVVDLRVDSPTHRKWEAFTLSADNGLGLFVPSGFAHGFQTLEDETDVLYQITPSFSPGFGRGVRWDDPAFGIDWPRPVSAISGRDATYGDYVA